MSAGKRQQLWLPQWISERNASGKYYREMGAIVKGEMLLKKAGVGQLAIAHIYQAYPTSQDGDDEKK